MHCILVFSRKHVNVFNNILLTWCVKLDHNSYSSLACIINDILHIGGSVNKCMIVCTFSAAKRAALKFILFCSFLTLIQEISCSHMESFGRLLCASGRRSACCMTLRPALEESGWLEGSVCWYLLEGPGERKVECHG